MKRFSNTIATIAIALSLTVLAQAAQQAPATAAAPAPAVIQTAVLPAASISPYNPLGLSADHATFWVADIEKETAWYENVLGFKEVQRRSQPDNEFRELRIGGVYRIDLAWRKGTTRHLEAKDAAMEQGFKHLVFKSADLNAAFKKLTEKSANVRAERDKDGGLTNVFAIDPEGNEIEIQQFE